MTEGLRLDEDALIIKRGTLVRNGSEAAIKPLRVLQLRERSSRSLYCNANDERD
jgi:hypothetical protein